MSAQAAFDLDRLLYAPASHRNLRTRFERFHAEHPEVYDSLVRLARQAKARGHDRIGIALLWEVVRWEQIMGKDPRETYKLDNGFRAFYSRLLASQEPDLAEMFETRKGTWNE